MKNFNIKRLLGKNFVSPIQLVNDDTLKSFQPVLKEIRRWNWEFEEFAGDVELDAFLAKHPECESMTNAECRSYLSDRLKIE